MSILTSNFGPISYSTAPWFIRATNLLDRLCWQTVHYCHISTYGIQTSFPQNLTVGKARDLGPWFVRADSLIPVRDKFADLVFQCHTIHTPVEEPHVKVQPADQVEVELVDSSGAEAKSTKDKMVVRRNITVNQFLLGDRPVQQQAQGRDHPPYCPCSKKATYYRPSP